MFAYFLTILEFYLIFIYTIYKTKNKKVCDNLFTRLTIDDKEKYLKYYNFEKYPHSQYNFTTLFAWQSFLDTSFDIIDGCFCIRHISNRKIYYMFPVGDNNPNDAIDYLCFKNPGSCILACVTEDMYDKIEKKDCFTKNDNRNNYDYVYETQKLISLSGKKLHSKKNHINKFLNTYNNYRFDFIDEKNIADCLLITDIWFKNKYDSLDKYALKEYYSIKDTLANIKPLGLKGIILYVNDTPAAYSIGEYMSTDTALIHIEKSTGIFNDCYPMINNLMCKYAFSGTSFINREEDMGMENLRKAKLSYRPCRFVEVCDLVKK